MGEEAGSSASWCHPDGTYLFLERSPDLVDEPHDRLRPGVNHLALTVEDRPTLDRLRAESSSHGWHELFSRPLPPRRGRGAHRAVPGELGGVRGRGRPGRLTGLTAGWRGRRRRGVRRARRPARCARRPAARRRRGWPARRARWPPPGVQRHRVEGVAAQADAGRLQQQLAGAGHVAADHDDRRVEQVHDAGQAPAEVQPGVLEGPLGADVARPRRGDDRVEVGAAAAARPSSPARCRSRCRPPGSRGCRSGTAGPGRRA